MITIIPIGTNQCFVMMNGRVENSKRDIYDSGLSSSFQVIRLKKILSILTTIFQNCTKLQNYLDSNKKSFQVFFRFIGRIMFANLMITSSCPA